MSNSDFNPMNYVTTNHFYVEIGGEIKGAFSECSGLGVTIDKEQYLEGGVNDQQRIILKQAKFSDVTLKRGITNDLSFLEWISQVLKGTPKQRLDVTIKLFNQAGETMQGWTLKGAIPVGWKAPSLQADGNSVAIEELTLAYEGLEIDVEKKPQGQSLSGNQGRNTQTGYIN